MSISLEKLTKYFTEKQYPLTRQTPAIINKIQNFTNKTAVLSQPVHLVEFVFQQDFMMQCNGRKTDTESMKLYELQMIESHIWSGLAIGLLEKVGIEQNSYSLIFDYRYVNTFNDLDANGMKIQFQKVRIFVVLFDELSYNLFRLTCKDYKNDRFFIDFEPTLYDQSTKI